jgi:hypothetical protein
MYSVAKHRYSISNTCLSSRETPPDQRRVNFDTRFVRASLLEVSFSISLKRYYYTLLHNTLSHQTR